MGRGYFSGHRFMKCFEYSPGFRIKGLKRNKVVRFPASDSFIPKQIKCRVLGNVDSTTLWESLDASTKERDFSSYQGGRAIGEACDHKVIAS